MRQGLLAIALVVAAFLGGAAVNGRALTWIKAYVAQALGDSDAPAAAQTVDKPAVPPGPPAASPDARTGLASGTAPPAGTGPVSDAKPDARTGTPSQVPAPHHAGTGGATASAAQASTPDEPPKAILPRPPFTLNFLGKKDPGKPPQDPTVKQAATNPQEPAPAPTSGSLALTKPEVAPRAEPIVPAPVPPGSHASHDAPGGSGQDWRAMRSRLKAAGVTRYAIESRPDGRALFRCTIPVEGLSAVSQQFEAEADDEFLAAEAALRRIQLWRAAEEP